MTKIHHILVMYNRSLLLKRNFYFAWQIYTTKQVTCHSISLRNQRNMDQSFIFWQKKSFAKSCLWLINYRVYNLALQNCQQIPSFPMKWCSLPRLGKSEKIFFFNISVAFGRNFFVRPSKLNLLEILGPPFLFKPLHIPSFMSIETVSKNSYRFIQQGETVLLANQRNQRMNFSSSGIWYDLWFEPIFSYK